MERSTIHQQEVIMVEITSNLDGIEAVRTVRQVRQYIEGDVSDDQLNQILEIARWTGSSRNTQPWQFVVTRDKETLRKLSELRPNITWVADGALAIAIVMPGGDVVHEAYDEGRVSERIMIAARMLGLGAGTAWFAERESDAKSFLGIPDDMTLHSVMVVGPYETSKDPRPTGPRPGRKPLSELVSYEKFGQK
jgi:nitroreductase